MLDILKRIDSKQIIKDIVKTSNRVTKYYILIDPVTGIAIKSAQYVAELLLDIENEINTTNSEENIKSILAEFKNKITKIEEKMQELRPKISLNYNIDKWEFTKSKNISSITDKSITEFRVNFIESIEEYDNYFVHCNVSGSICEIDKNGINIEIPIEYINLKKPIKLYTQKIFF